MNRKEIERASLELMEAAEAVYVSTIDEEGFPQTRCMFNLRNKAQFPRLVDIFKDHKDDFMILFTTNTSLEKIAQIRRNPAVCLYYCIPSEFHGLMLSGNIEILDDPNIREAIWHDGWERYYPKGPLDPDHMVLRLCPRKAKGWHKGQPIRFTLSGAK